jgi:glycosyltransferase involved in cell wall biosynthesis
LAAKRLGIPVTVRGDSHLQTPRGLLKRTGKRLIYPGVLRVFDTALYVGERSRQYWEYYGYPSERLFFSPHCVDNAWFAQRATAKAGQDLRRRHGIDADAKVILFAGKLVPFKRPLDLIAAAVRLHSRIPKIVVLVSGSGPLEAEMIAAAKAGKVRVVHLGFCNQTEMPAAYAAADVLALPSDGRETWGLVTNEALACGTPIVISDACGCAPDLAVDGLVGRYFPMGNVERFSDSLLAVLEAQPTREMIQHKAADYSIDAAAAGIVDAGVSMANRRRGTG